MKHHLTVLADADTVAAAAAAWVAEQARAAIAARGSFTFAVSGGHTPWAMFERLAVEEVPWPEVTLYQVDERVAPIGDTDRNLLHLRASLDRSPARIRPMPVEASDLEAAAASYEAELPDRFDLVHLGLGSDGHTASLMPGDPVLGVDDRLVATTESSYEGHRRMTLTFPALSRARQLLWIVTGAAKRGPLAELVAGDSRIPAGRVDGPRSLILADRSAAVSAERGRQAP